MVKSLATQDDILRMDPVRAERSHEVVTGCVLAGCLALIIMLVF